MDPKANRRLALRTPWAQGIGSILRDVRFLQVGAQVVFVVLLALAGSWLGSNLLQALDALGLNLGLGFFKQTAGFVIGQGPPMERSDTFLRAYVVGVANTLSVISLGLALATILGILAGVSLVSPNWLLRSIVRIYVEVVRNTPLLVQLFFLYFAVILQLPSLKDRITLGPVVLSQRGLYLPRAIPGQHQLVWLGLTVGAIIAATVARDGPYPFPRGIFDPAGPTLLPPKVQ